MGGRYRGECARVAQKGAGVALPGHFWVLLKAEIAPSISLLVSGVSGVLVFPKPVHCCAKIQSATLERMTSNCSVDFTDAMISE